MLMVDWNHCADKAAFHDTDTDIIARIDPREESRVSVSVSWNAAYNKLAKNTDNNVMYVKELVIIK